MKEIGGYLEFEDLGGREYYPDLLKLNLGRTACTFYLKGTGVRRLYMPVFMCASVIDAVREAGIELVFYNCDRRLHPVLSDLPAGPLPEGECLFLCNAYGQLENATILSLKETYEHILVDNTHAFFQAPAPGVAPLYSVRKFFGVTDGAYLASDVPLAPPEERDESHARFSHILGRYEKDAGTFYKAMLDNAHSYEGAPVMRMSRLTEDLLGALPYERIEEQRKANYACLADKLDAINPLSALFHTPCGGPFVYPFYINDGPAVRKALAARKIFVPTYWTNVMADAAPGSVEADYAANILALPCDQRYGAKEMDAVAEAVLACL